MLKIFKVLFITLLLLFLSCNSSAADNKLSGNKKKSLSFHEEEIQFIDETTTLYGTLFLPVSDHKYPAVVILSGSDRSRRGPLRIKIAKYFAAHGVAALVYDSPGTGRSTGNALFQTRKDRVKEALSGIMFLQKRKGINSNSTGLFGGSEGADIALLAAAESPGIAFVISVSGAMGVSILDVLRYSAEKKGYKDGLTLNEIIKAKTFKEIAFVLFSGVNIIEWHLIETRVKEWKDKTWSKLINIAKLRLKKLNTEEKGIVFNTFKQVIGKFKEKKWFNSVDIGNSLQRIITLDVDTFFKILEMPRYSRDWDRNLQDISGIRCPILAIWGEEDSFIPPNQSAMKLKKALDDMGHREYKIKIFRKASHFITSPGSTTRFVSGYLELITDWIRKHTGVSANRRK